MRKLALLFLSSVLLTSTAFSQDNAGSTDKFRFGLHFSPNIAWEKPDNAGISKDGSALGFSFGLISEFNLSNRYAFLTGVNVCKVNTAVRYDIILTSVEVSNKFQYVEIPLALKLKTNEIGYLTYFGKFGITPAYTMKATSEALGTTTNIKDDAQPLRMGLIIGIGAEYNLSGSTSLLVGVDFNNGFTNLYQKSAGNDLAGNRLKSINNMISLNLGVFF